METPSISRSTGPIDDLNHAAAEEQVELTVVETTRAAEWSGGVDGDAGAVVPDAGPGGAGDAVTTTKGTTDAAGSTAAAAAAAADPHRRRFCESCGDWWRSSAGGKAGVVNVALGIITVLVAAFTAATPFVVDKIIRGTNVAEANRSHSGDRGPPLRDTHRVLALGNP